MNEWLQDYLGAAPDQRFYEWKLMMHCLDFEELRAQGLLVRDMEAEKSDFLITKYGRCLHLVRFDGIIFGVDTEDCEDPFVEVDPRELIQYYFNWDPWLRKVREVNGLDGESSWLHPRLAFLGEKIYDGRRLSVVLGFLSLPDEAMDLLLSLPARMPSKYDIVVVTSLIPHRLPQQDIAALERLGVYIVPPIDRETLKIKYPRLQPKRREIYSTVLSPAQEADSKITSADNNEVQMKDVCTFTFPKDIGRDVIEHAITSAIFNAEYIFGKPKLKVSGIAYRLSEDGSECTIDVSSKVGEHVAQVFTGILMNTLGEQKFQVRRIEGGSKESRRH